MLLSSYSVYSTKMKQSGVRLVQRKFAQGVPIPASASGITAPPPERKVEPPCPPKNVYHNNMSARSLLDIVSMQNIHKHKQEPLVVLERLRADEIPAPPVSKVCVRLRKRRGRGLNNNNMCLRSGKRKSPDAGKGPAKKRKKLSSESTDDVPLMYYFNRPNQAKPLPGQKPKDTVKKGRSLDREKRTPRTPTPKWKERVRTLSSTGKPAATRTQSIVSAKTDERSFTFKEPSSPARLSYRLFKKKAAAKAGRALKKAGPPSTRWSGLRSARAPSEPRLARPLRAAVLLGKKPPEPAVRKGLRRANKGKEELRPSLPGPSLPGPSLPGPSLPGPSLPGPSLPGPSLPGPSLPGPSLPGPSGSKVSRAPSSDSSSKRLPRGSSDSFSTIMGDIGASFDQSSTSMSLHVMVNMPSPTLSFDPDLESASGLNRDQDWCIQGNADAKSVTSDESDIIKLYAPQNTTSSLESIIEENIIMEVADSELSQAKDNTEDRIVTDNNANKDNTKENNDSKRDEPTKSLEAEKRQEELAADKSDRVNENRKSNENVARTDVGLESGRVEETVKKSVKPKQIPRKPAEKNEKEKRTRKPAPKSALTKIKKTTPSRAAKTVPEETPAPTRLLRNSREAQQPPNPDVYEFDAELEASRPPSGLRRRGQATPDPPPAHPPAASTSSESVEYVDIFPTSSHCIQITPQKQQESGAECLSVRLVPKEEISIKKKKNLIENLSNSPALLNKFFNCLTAELQNELDNLITAEGLNEPSASTSKEDASTYLDQKAGSVFEAPTFYPTAEEFQDPIKYYDKIAPQASKYGLCKIVPPDGFKPPCNMSDTIRFAVVYQYISKMYSRWGPVSRELAAIKAHLRTQSVVFARSPLLDGSEVNLPKLYQAVEQIGGLTNVIRRNCWGRVADEMKLTKLQHPERKLDPIYMRYLLPYATLSAQERKNIMAEVEKCWTTKYQKMLERARNPFQRQNRMLGTECESESDEEGEDGNTAGALHEAEDCIVQGRTMNLVTFKKIATSLMDAHFEPNKQPPSAIDVEKAYWRAVLLGTEHIVANTASIDTGEEGYGFPKDAEAEYGTHSWNLKVLARNPNNVLRYLGPVLGVTVPTLHLSMLFSTSCWHRDPHGLPWTEYMHSGAEKIWYGIPRDESTNFRRAIETLCPAYCQNKSIWLASEITMVPPNILSGHGVKLSRLLQRPGEYVLVFPEAHSCSITTGFGISESVYFASNGWLADVYKLFQELRNSCEPTMFSLEQLLLNGSADCAAQPQVCSVLCTLLAAELEHRRALELKGLKVQERPESSAPLNTSYFRAWNTRDQDECEYCRSTLFLSKVTGLTGRKSAVCPEHALRLLETKKYKNVDLSTLELLSSYTTSALEEMLERLESRTGTDAQSRAPSVIDLTDSEGLNAEAALPSQ